MKFYKILVIALLLKNNSLAKYGTVVKGDQLSRSADELVKEGYLEEIENKSNEVPDPTESNFDDNEELEDDKELNDLINKESEEKKLESNPDTHTEQVLDEKSVNDKSDLSKTSSKPTPADLLKKNK